ncbi:MAG: TcdA/TcdB pore-forming domain-containing protein, partial [Billgrantia desiderata]
MMGFETPEALRAGLTAHFVNNGFGQFYRAYGEGAPRFEVRQINIDAMTSVRLTGALRTVAELALPGSRTQAREVERVAGAAVQMSDALAHDAMLKSSLSVFESLNLAESFHTAMQHLYTQEGLAPGWLPVFDNITEQGNGRYRVPLMGPDGALREVVTSDARIWTFKNHYQEMLTRINGLYAYEGGRLLLRGTPETAKHVDGLNTAFAVQSIMGLLRKHNAERGGAIEPELDRALEIHTYVNMAQVAHGTVVDAATVVQLYRVALTEAKPVVNASMSAIGHAANEGAAFLFGIANVGLDAFELSRASNEVQKATFGTQLAFDSASLVATSAGLGAGLLGASTASAVLGGAGVIVAGLGIGFSALAQAFGFVAQDAQAVGRYVDQLDGAYQRGGYESQTLT